MGRGVTAKSWLAPMLYHQHRLAVVKAGLLLNRELGLPAVVGGDLAFQAANPAGSEGGIDLIPPHRIAGVRLTPIPPQQM